jgi:hypothetical protein
MRRAAANRDRTRRRISPAHNCLVCGIPPRCRAHSYEIKWDTVSLNFRPISFKTNGSDPHKVGHFFVAGLPVSMPDRAPEATASGAREFKRAWEIKPLVAQTLTRPEQRRRMSVLLRPPTDNAQPRTRMNPPQFESQFGRFSADFSPAHQSQITVARVSHHAKQVSLYLQQNKRKQPSQGVTLFQAAILASTRGRWYARVLCTGVEQ